MCAHTLKIDLYQIVNDFAKKGYFEILYLTAWVIYIK